MLGIRLRALAAGFLYVTLGLIPAYADDTEIYFGGSQIASAQEVRPNILFVLDTSGSMKWDLDDDGGSSYDRMDALVEAMQTTLSTANNANIGIMRLNWPGGSMLHKVENIDGLVGDGIQLVTSQVDSSQNDASESLLGGNVYLTDGSLTFMERPLGPSGSIDVEIFDDNDFAPEIIAAADGYDSSGRVGDTWDTSCPALIDRYYNCDSNSGDLYKTLVGARFKNLGIPSGVEITSADITFRIDDKQDGGTGENGNSLVVNIQAEPVDSGEFDIGNSTYGISKRARTSAVVNWFIDENPNAGEHISTPDLTNILTELMNEPGWDENSNATFIFSEAVDSNGGRREIKTENQYGRPKLHVEYISASESQSVGLRFTDIDVPAGATITSAHLEFTADRTNSDSATYTIAVESAASPAEFTDTTNNVQSRTTGAEVIWSDVEAWTKDENYTTPDLTDLVQERVSDADWCGGNAMAFVLTGSATGVRSAYSFDGNSSLAPRLVIEYDSSSVPEDAGCVVSEELPYKISADTDDAEQSNDSGNTSTNGKSLDLRSNMKRAGVRFNGIAIPQGAEINSAYLALKTRGAGGGDAVNIKISAENTDDAQTYDGSRNDLTDRSLTGDVAWRLSDWDASTIYQSTDISDLVQRVVDRPGWGAGNSMAFILRHDGGDNIGFSSREDDPDNPASLVISYTSTGSVVVDTVRTELKELISSQINRTTIDGGTPIVDALYEAALYMRGESVLYGLTRSSEDQYADTTRVSSSDSWTGGTLVREPECTDDNLNHSDCKSEEITGNPRYISPIEYSCQQNHIVYLTDGETTANYSRDEVASLIGKECTSSVSRCTTTTNWQGEEVESCSNYNYNSSEKCGTDLAHFLANTDQDSGVGALAGDQVVKTHTISLALDDANAIQWLKELAKEGGGDFYSATGSDVSSVAAQLTSAFKTIIGGVLNIDTSFAAPSVSVNQFNRLTHRDEIYYAVFKPQEDPNWPGNLKKFGLSGADVDIVDSDGNQAVDSTTGKFYETSRSYWLDALDADDGNSVILGGANSKTPAPDQRKIYVYHGTSSSKDLTAPDNLLTQSNLEITNSMLGVAWSERNDIINWIRGYDVADEDANGSTSDLRHVMSDPLHSRPVVVTYSSDQDPNGDGDFSDATEEYYLFYGTNGGMLHAVNGNTGVEKFAVTVEELLPNFETFYENNSGTTRPYGLDGSPTVWVNDVNGDGTIDADAGDHVYLYIGMRRGGRNYYAFDFTDIDEPKFLWQVTGGSGDFAELGQTWSKPLLTKINYKNGSDIVTEEVLVFGGGYDENQDGVNERTVDSVGRGIYMVNAETGALMWKAGKGFTGNAENVAAMDYSIPAQLTGVDINNDSILDSLFFGDMGGQVFRVDFDTTGASTLARFSNTQRIATLAANDSAADTRRFYHGVDVALTRKGSDKYLTILIGSGYRAHPLNTTVVDRFYAIKQSLDATATSVNLTESSLYDATDNDIQDAATDADKAAAQTLLDSKNGWYITMENSGEKVLSRPVVFEGSVIFVTYEPEISVVDCTPKVGVSREYIVKVSDATAVIDRNDDDDKTKSDRSGEVALTGIVDDTVLVMTDEGIQLFLGTQKTDYDLGSDRAVRTFWYQE